ncbi:MAG: M1 family aminopeptidase, partial [candidate division WOR-3 bacterium]
GNFGRMIDMLQFFSQESLYGLYPFFGEKYGMVAVYPFPWGGMEHQTMTTIHRSWARNGSDNGIAHELSHQWWGDMVTCLDWRNIWLNEGFATYSDELYDYHQNGLGAFLARIRSRAQDYFDEETQDPHPIYNPPPGHEFDWGHSYCKGAWVQHMLRYLVGDTSWAHPGLFFRALRAYGDSFRYKNANTEDYQRIFERETGLVLDWFFNEWVYQLGYPNYRVGWQGREVRDGWEVVIDLAQENMSGAPETFHMPVEVRVRFATGDTLIRYPVTANPQRNIFPVRAEPLEIEFDPNEWLLDEHTVAVGVGELPGSICHAAPIFRLLPNPCRLGPEQQVQILYEPSGLRPLHLEVFDPAGRLIRRLTAGPASALWDLTDDAGHRVGPGVYLVRLAGPRRLSSKLVVSD